MTIVLDQRFNDFVDDTYGNTLIPVLGKKRSASELLSVMDPDLYEARLEEWLEQQLDLALGQDGLSNAHFVKNRERFHWLARLVAKQRVVPFIGAGVSAACGVPTWSGYLRKLAVENGYSLKELAKHMSDGRFEDAASDLLAKLGEGAFREAFDRSFAGASPERSNELGRLVLSTFGGPVITTNYDQLLEGMASPSFKQTFQGRFPGEFQRAAREGLRVLLKVHGDLYHPESRVLTRHEYDVAYGIDGPSNIKADLSRVLRSTFLRDTVLFIGASLSNDRTMTLLREVAQDPADGHAMRHFAIVELPPKSADISKREQFLAARSIFPIWYKNGEHQFVPDILRHLSRVARDLR